MTASTKLRCLCGATNFDVVFTYREPPAGEVRFQFAGDRYFRRVMRCGQCGHFLSRHEMDMSKLYDGAYVDATYGADGMSRTFARIIGLDPAKSDNVGRVKKVVEYARRHFGRGGREPYSVLDVGSGLCVFLHRLKQETGWNCTAIDPDPRAVTHARERAGVDAICGDFMNLDQRTQYDIITYNKVLEHVVDPVAMLERSHRLLNRSGFVYVELPDGEAASVDGPGREEFFIDHHHIFGGRSLEILAKRAGYDVRELERLREPSGKYTLRAFLAAPSDDGARVKA